MFLFPSSELWIQLFTRICVLPSIRSSKTKMCRAITVAKARGRGKIRTGNAKSVPASRHTSQRSHHDTSARSTSPEYNYVDGELRHWFSFPGDHQDESLSVPSSIANRRRKESRHRSLYNDVVGLECVVYQYPPSAARTMSCQLCWLRVATFLLSQSESNGRRGQFAFDLQRQAMLSSHGGQSVMC